MPTSVSSERQSRIKVILRLLLLASIVCSVASLFWFRPDIEGLLAWLSAQGSLGAVLYVAFYTVAPLAGFPALPLTILGGAVFGAWQGALLAIAGATLADSLGFVLARYAMADWFAEKLSGRGRQIKEVVEAEGWRAVAFLRLTPIFPFWLVSYAMGLTSISFATYALTTFFCILPAASAYAWLGAVGREAAREGQVRAVLIGIAAVAVLGFGSVWVARRLRKKQT